MSRKQATRSLTSCTREVPTTEYEKNNWSSKAGERVDERVEVRSAATGRRRAPRLLEPSDTVRLEVRLPAPVAAALFGRAHADGRPISTVVSTLLTDALNGPREAPIT